MDAKRIYFLSIFIIWLFNVSGIIGIFVGYEDWFLSLTPLNLSMYLIVILWNEQFDKKLLLALCIPFGIGMIAEMLGVNYGWIFGNYQYGNNLGIKVAGVPLMIGVNWAILTYCTATIARKIDDHTIVSSTLAAMLMTGLDVVIEVSAPRFDFWEFEGGVVPLQNYVGWMITAFVIQLLFQKIIKSSNYPLALHIFLAIIVFFTIFLFI